MTLIYFPANILGQNVLSPNPQPGTDGFFPFSAADPLPPSPQSNTLAVREMTGRGIPSVAAAAPDEDEDVQEE